jgi:hypothetical protein
MGDLQSKRWIVAKGIMFLAIAILAAALVLRQLPSLWVAALLAIIMWAAARFYYFLFYVLHHYVDPSLRYSGIAALISQILARRRGEEVDRK